MKLSKKFSDPRMSTLAERSRMDTFAKVKESIQEMVTNLVKEKEDEIKHKDYCIEELNNNERDIENKERDKADLKAKAELKRAGEDREKENREYQLEVADQRATVKLL